MGLKNKWTLKEIYLLFLAVSLLIYGAYNLFFKNSESDGLKSLTEDPEIVSYQQIHQNPLILEVERKDGTSYSVFSEAVGYQSTIKVRTDMNLEGELIGVSIISQGETVSYFDKIENAKYVNRFKGLTAFEPVYVGRAKAYAGSSEGIKTNNSVDAIGGATVSSVAIAKAVTTGTIALADKVFNQTVENPYVESTIKISDFLLLAVFVVAAMTSYFQSLKKYRTAILLYSALVVGFVCNKFITFSGLVALANGSWPDLSNLSWYILMFSTFGLLIVTGRNVYCTWVCPFGASQEVILKVGSLKTQKIHPKMVGWLRLIRPTLAYLAIMIALYKGNMQSLSYEPFSGLFNQVALPIMWMTLPILIFVSLIHYRFYCTYLCPVGFIIDLCAKVRNQLKKIVGYAS